MSEEREVQELFDAIGAFGKDALQRERQQARSLGDKIIVTLKLAAFNTFGLMFAPVKWAIYFGLDYLANAIGAGLADSYGGVLNWVKSQPNCPDELKTVIDRSLEGGGEWQALLVGSTGGTAASGLIGSLLGPFLKDVEHAGWRTSRAAIMEPAQLLAAWWMGEISEPEFYRQMISHGYPDEDVDRWKRITRTLMSAEGLIRYRWRYGMSDSEFHDRMRRIGWEPDEADMLAKVSLYYPSPDELVHWQAREVFEPEMISRYGLDDEFDRIDLTAFRAAGMSDEQSRNFWRAHWQHPSWEMMVELLHRGLVTQEEIWEWFRLVEIPPYWRDKLIKAMYNVPTRVDVRRWWDMGTIDEERLREVYRSQGYFGDDLDDYVLWTKVYVAFPDLMARFTKGWITQDEVLAELTALGMPDDRAGELLQTKVMAEREERVAKERDLTKAEIVKGVKNGVISWSDGIELLMDMGYDEWEAGYILAVNVGAATGSPETLSEFRSWTQWYRGLTGRAANPPGPAIAEAERDYREAAADVEELMTTGAGDRAVAEAQDKLRAAELLYHQLLARQSERSE